MAVVNKEVGYGEGVRTLKDIKVKGRGGSETLKDIIVRVCWERGSHLQPNMETGSDQRRERERGEKGGGEAP